MRRPYEWTNDERSGLANCVEGSELNPHRERFCRLYGFQCTKGV